MSSKSSHNCSSSQKRKADNEHRQHPDRKLPKLDKLENLADPNVFKQKLPNLTDHVLHQCHNNIIAMHTMIHKERAKRELAEDLRKQEELVKNERKKKYLFIKVISTAGNIYFVNRVTRESQWKSPCPEEGKYDPDAKPVTAAEIDW